MEEQEQKYIDIHPLTKWKRLLVFLGDYFISFIIAFTLFNLAIFPLAKIAFGTQSKSEHASALEKQAVSLLIEDMIPLTILLASILLNSLYTI